VNRSLAAIGTAGLLVAASTSAWASGPQPVITTPYARTPAGNSTYLVWSMRSPGKSHYNAYWRRKSWNASRRINPSGTDAFLGGIDGTRVVYQLVSGSQSDIELFDIRSRTPSEPPPGVNTSAWEREPTLSAPYILFGRGNPANHNTVRKVILFNMATAKSTLLAKTGPGVYSVVPGQVNGHFATWWRCSTSRCDVFRRDLGTGKTIMVPNPGGKLLYASSVSPTGTVFVARSGFGCGAGVSLLRFRAGRVTTLASFGKGIDIGQSFAYTAGGKTTVLFDRLLCKDKLWDIYKVVTK